MLSQKTETPSGGKPSAKKEIVTYLRTHSKSSIERSCKVIKLHRSMWYYRSKKDDSEVIEKLNQLAESHPKEVLMSTLVGFGSRALNGTENVF